MTNEKTNPMPYRAADAAAGAAEAAGPDMAAPVITPDDVARAIAFLAAEYDGFISGATLDINGGIYRM